MHFFVERNKRTTCLQSNTNCTPVLLQSQGYGSWVIACKGWGDHCETKAERRCAGLARYPWMYLAQWPVGSQWEGLYRSKREERCWEKKNSLCSAVAMSWSLPVGEQIRTEGKESGQQRTEGSNREVWSENTRQPAVGGCGGLVRCN